MRQRSRQCAPHTLQGEATVEQVTAAAVGICTSVACYDWSKSGWLPRENKSLVYHLAKQPHALTDAVETVESALLKGAVAPADRHPNPHSHQNSVHQTSLCPNIPLALLSRCCRGCAGPFCKPRKTPGSSDCSLMWSGAVTDTAVSLFYNSVWKAPLLWLWMNELM